jgi:hypothetical protein
LCPDSCFQTSVKPATERSAGFPVFAIRGGTWYDSCMPFPQPPSFVFSRKVGNILTYAPGQPPVKLISFHDYIGIDYAFEADITLRNGSSPIIIGSYDTIGAGTDGWRLKKNEELSFKVNSSLLLYAVRETYDPTTQATCDVLIVVNPHPVIKTTIGGMSTNISEKVI